MYSNKVAANKCVQPFRGLINLHFLFETVINHYPPDHCCVLTEIQRPFMSVQGIFQVKWLWKEQFDVKWYMRCEQKM